jgi:hypothetical protein
VTARRRSLVWAARDPDGPNLDGIQIVKGWLEEGEMKDTVHKAIASGDRLNEDGTADPVDAPIDMATGQFNTEKGSSELTALRTDPDFEPAPEAYYYVRVLQLSTRRWTLFDEIREGVEYPDDVEKALDGFFYRLSWAPIAAKKFATQAFSLFAQPSPGEAFPPDLRLSFNGRTSASQAENEGSIPVKQFGSAWNNQQNHVDTCDRARFYSHLASRPRHLLCAARQASSGRLENGCKLTETRRRYLKYPSDAVFRRAVDSSASSTN